MWIFGYGSLIWRPDFDFVERTHGYVRGWQRVFWQGSTDHRGVPGAPGRVVTLLQEPGVRCWGTAYRIEGEVRDRVLDELDHREKGGYERHEVDVWGNDDRRLIESALVYVATRDNPHFLGPEEPEAIARQILRSRGPSGPNIDYLMELERSLREDLKVDDQHVFELARLVRILSEEAK